MSESYQRPDRMISVTLLGVGALLVFAYLIGSINTALLIARVGKVDIRSVGSGNPGASNILRAMGRGPAAAVYIGDLLKGLLPSSLGLIAGDPTMAALAGVGSVIGHCYPVFHRFRGGKGVATTSGVVLVLSPLVMVVMIGVYVVGVAVTRISAVGSLAAVLVTVPALLLAGIGYAAVGWFAIIVAVIFYRHRSNLARLRSGAENRLAR